MSSAKTGFIRLYRGESDYSGPDRRSEWIRQAQQESGQLHAEGRWWTDQLEIAQWYKDEAGSSGRIVRIDVPAAVAEQFRVSRLGSDVTRFSRDPQNEFFLPRALIESSTKVIEASSLEAAARQAAVKHRPVRQAEAKESDANDYGC